MSAFTPSSPIDPPTEIVLHQQSRQLEIVFGEVSYRLSFEFLRVHSPSASVQGHGPGQEVLQTGKREVTVSEIEPIGHYAIRPTFSDGHDSGIFTWAYLRDLGHNHDVLWADYLKRLAAAGESRNPPGFVEAKPIHFVSREARRR